MEWFSTAAAAAVIDKKFEALPETFEVKTYWFKFVWIPISHYLENIVFKIQ